jgi:hypothetical protein
MIAAERWRETVSARRRENWDLKTSDAAARVDANATARAEVFDLSTGKIEHRP